MRVGRVFKTSVILPLWLLFLCCFLNFEYNGLLLTDGWISGTDLHLDGGFALPTRRFLESSWTTHWFLDDKMQISTNNGSDCNNNALLLSAPWPVNVTPIFDPWNFNTQRKTKRSKARILYYSNSTASYQVLIRSGDISLNPGPAKCGSGMQSAGNKQKTSRNVHRVPVGLKCDNCDKTIRKNQKSVACEVCFGQQHMKCTDLNVKGFASAWTCPKCLLSVLPFFNCPYLDTLEELDDSALDITSLQISEILRKHPKDLSIMHFNTQSMVSSFNEFQVLVSQLPMDIITMSETWLRNNPPGGTPIKSG